MPSSLKKSNNIHSPAEASVHRTRNTTKVNLVKSEHTWVIQEFLKIMEFGDGRGLWSPVFNVPFREGGKNLDMSFRLFVSFNSKRRERKDKEYVALNLKSETERPDDPGPGATRDKVCVGYKVYVQQKNGAPWKKSVLGGELEAARAKHRFVRKSTLGARRATLLPGGALTIVCSMEMCSQHPRSRASRNQSPLRTFSVGKQIEKNGREFSDVTLMCEDQSLPCHKVVLASQSDVFAAMFSHKGTYETRSNRVVIKDLSSDTVKAFLKFLYTGSCSYLTGGTLEQLEALLEAAEKYNVNVLKQACEEELSKLISKHNVVDLAITACMYNASRLEEDVVYFISSNLVAARRSKNWSEIPSSLIHKILSAVRELQ